MHKDTSQAIVEAEHGINVSVYDSADDLFDDLKGGDIAMNKEKDSVEEEQEQLKESVLKDLDKKK